LRFLWFSSVLPHKCQASFLNFFHIIHNEADTCHQFSNIKLHVSGGRAIWFMGGLNTVKLLQFIIL
jgi:hypothetical protein